MKFDGSSLSSLSARKQYAVQFAHYGIINTTLLFGKLLTLLLFCRLSVKRSSLKEKISISQNEAKAEAILRKHPELAFLITVMQLSL